ncbi:MAG: PKD domain-containing protein [Cytophagales bacterium]|nr:PKD domain-containing protein [Cytophagales bacterium]
MKFITLFTLLLLFSLNLEAQTFKKIPPVVCPADPNSYDTRVRLPDHIKVLIEQKKSGRLNASSGATINVTYTGFTAEAQAAFQHAVDIWAALLNSPVTINVDAQFAELGQRVLGSAGPGNLVRDFPNAPNDTTFYHIALAEKIAGKDLNSPGDPDIGASFSSTFPWYYGTDGKTPPDVHDFVTVVLHELGHGLGFSGVEGYDDTTNEGTWDWFDSKVWVYNLFAELGDGTRLIDLPNESIEVGNAIVGGDLFFNGPLAVTSLGERPELYAPATYNGGSSFSHLDESTYSAGNPHSLMSPQVGSGESIHDPGVSLDIFADMGWFITVLDHEPITFVDNFVDDIVFETTIRTDTTIASNSLQVVYSNDDFQTETMVSLANMGGNLFSASISNPGMNSTIKYYFEGLTDDLGRTITSPGNAPDNFYTLTVHDHSIVSVPFGSAEGGDFESGAVGFVSVPLVGDLNLWELGTPTNVLVTSSSATNVWKTDLDANLFEDEKRYSSALISPGFDLSDEVANYEISFELAMDLGDTDGNLFETGPLRTNLEVSTDMGTTWNVLGNLNDEGGENWYNFEDDFSVTVDVTGATGVPSWVFEDLTGRTVNYNISSYAGNADVRFRLVAYMLADYIEDGYITDGLLMDNFEISKGTPTADFKLVDATGVLFPGGQIEFEYISSGATSYLWDFGDGTTSVDENPSHTYTSGGVFDVSLTIQSPLGPNTVTKDGAVTIIGLYDGSSYTLADGGNFETDNGDFIPENISGTGFERGNSSIAGKDGTSSGSFAWVTGISNAEYVDNSKAFLYTPMFDFNAVGAYTFSFRANYNTEEAWDGFIVEYTTDNGLTWQQLDPVVAEGWYDGIGEDNEAQGWPAIPLFSGNSGGYVSKSRDISSLAGNPEIGFRFHWLSDAAETVVGIAIDDFTLTGPEVSGPAVAEFSVSNTTFCQHTEVEFTNESEGAYSSIEWNFGGPGAFPETATGVGPHAVTYASAGTYTVTLTVQGIENGEQIEEKVDLISVAAIHVPMITSELQSFDVYLLTASAGDAYQWYVDNVIIDGATSQTLLVDETGLYSVEVTIDGCTVATSEQNSIDIITAITDEVIDLAIYPNPVTRNIVNFTISDNQNGQVEIIFLNLSGQVVKAISEVKSSTNFNKSYDVSELSNGIYFVSIKIDSAPTAVRKLILSR